MSDGARTLQRLEHGARARLERRVASLRTHGWELARATAREHPLACGVAGTALGAALLVSGGEPDRSRERRRSRTRRLLGAARLAALWSIQRIVSP